MHAMLWTQHCTQAFPCFQHMREKSGRPGQLCDVIMRTLFGTRTWFEIFTHQPGHGLKFHPLAPALYFTLSLHFHCVCSYDGTVHIGCRKTSLSINPPYKRRARAVVNINATLWTTYPLSCRTGLQGQSFHVLLPSFDHTQYSCCKKEYERVNS